MAESECLDLRATEEFEEGIVWRFAIQRGFFNARISTRIIVRRQRRINLFAWFLLLNSQRTYWKRRFEKQAALGEIVLCQFYYFDKDRAGITICRTRIFEIIFLATFRERMHIHWKMKYYWQTKTSPWI